MAFLAAPGVSREAHKGIRMCAEAAQRRWPALVLGADGVASEKRVTRMCDLLHGMGA